MEILALQHLELEGDPFQKISGMMTLQEDENLMEGHRDFIFIKSWLQDKKTQFYNSYHDYQLIRWHVAPTFRFSPLYPYKPPMMTSFLSIYSRKWTNIFSAH